MKKLSKEQAEWLCKKFDEVSVECDFYGPQVIGSALHEATVKRIINQCTEKEFPDFEFLFERKGELLPSSFIVSLTPQDTLFICLGDDDGNFHHAHSSYNEFKQFTEGCNKIVEWIEEQEKDFS